MEQELRVLMTAIQDLIDGGDTDDESVKAAFKIMVKYEFMEDENGMFIYPGDILKGEL